MFPIWTIVLITILIIIAISIAIYFIKRRRSRSLSVHTLHEGDEEGFKEKQSISTGSLQTLAKHTSLPPANTSTPQLPASNELEYNEPPEKPPQEIRISLPLLPPSTSFFSDKMELEGGGQDIYDLYHNSKKIKKEEGFLLQKAATIRSTLRQSLKLQQRPNNNNNSNDSSSNNNNNNRNSVLNVFDQQPAEPRISFTTVTEPESSTKISVEETRKPQINTAVEHVVTIEENDESPVTLHLQEPIHAAKRVIRSASRKTKARNIDDGSEEKVKHGSIRFGSIRSLKANGEHMTITSGSMRRFLRESLPNEEGGDLSIGSTRKTTRKSGTSAAEMSSWWDNVPKETPTASSGVDSDSPHQYRASLNASIFAGTLSRASGSNASLFTDILKENTNTNASVSRHSSFRKGTLGRNTLRSITTTATNGVNRSLKGLFDYSSSNVSSNRVVPDDSQKTELDDEPTIPAAEEKSVIGQHSTLRNKSLCASTVLRPKLPTSYLPTSESSTKYALPDKEETDLSNRKNQEPLEKKVLSASSSYSEHNNVETSPTSTNSPLSPITVISDRTSGSLASTSQPGEVDAIRRVLQDTWINNMKESGSSYSMLSDTDIDATSSTHFSTNKLNPRPQTQSLLGKSLLTQQAAKRASLLARRSMHEDDFANQQGPEPSASFSSSTVRTVIPANEQPTEPLAVRQNAINQKNGSNKIQESSFESHHMTSRFSPPPMTETSSPRHSSADSSRGHSRKSSGGNSAATALRISSGYAVNAKTWNGRKSASRPFVKEEPLPEDMYRSVGRNNSLSKRAYFSTMRKGQKSRGNIPWMESEESIEKTPAQAERDKYLDGKS